MSGEGEHDLFLKVGASFRVEDLLVGERRAHGKELFSIFKVTVEEIRVVLKDVLFLEVDVA